MGSSTHQNDGSKESGMPSHSNSFVGGSRGRSNDLAPKESRSAAGEFQKPFQGKSEDIVPLTLRGVANNKGNRGDHMARNMDPLTRWVSQGKADEPWHILDIVDSSGTYQLIKSGMGKTEDNSSVEVEGGSVQSEKISKH